MAVDLDKQGDMLLTAVTASGGHMNTDTVEFVRAFFGSHDPIGTELSYRYPFRRRFDHCLRCSVWARRIALEEHGDVEIAETAALFHDIGKAVRTDQSHGVAGSEICAEYLGSIGYDGGRTAIISGIVSNHSQHAHHTGATLEERIVSDADVIDETGAIAILWDAMACALEPDSSYLKAYERSIRLTAPLRGSVPQQLHTAAAKRMAEEGFSIVDAFLKSLEYELGLGEGP